MLKLAAMVTMPARPERPYRHDNDDGALALG